MNSIATHQPVRRASWTKSDEAKGLAMMSPTFLFAVAVIFFPILIIFAHSFWTQDYLTIDHTFTLNNYYKAVSEPIYRDLFVRSLYVSMMVSVLTVVLSYPVAAFISFHGGKQKNLWLFLVTIPCWTSYLLRVMSWKVMLGYEGVINSGLMYTGIIDKPLTSILYNANAVIITLFHSWAAFAILPIFVSLEKIDRSLIEAARDLGDSRLRAFFRVILPLSMPGVISAFLIVMIPTVGDYVTPKLVGGKEGVMIANAIQSAFGKGADWPLGAALSITTMVIVSALAAIIVLSLKTLARRIR